MKTLGTLLIVALVIVGGVWMLGKERAPALEDTTLTYTSSKYGIIFDYPKGYFINERLASGSAMREHFTIMLVENTEFNRKLVAGEILGTEGPVSINFDIYQNNLDKQSLNAWLTNANDSNFKLSGGILASTTVAGREALSYTWDGLYRGDSTVFLNGDYLIMSTVTYHSPQDQIRKDFEKILDSVTLK